MFATTLAPTFSSPPSSSPVISVRDAVYEYETVGTLHSQTHADTQDTVEHQTTRQRKNINYNNKDTVEHQTTVISKGFLCQYSLICATQSENTLTQMKEASTIYIQLTPILKMKICKPRSGRVTEKLQMRYLQLFYWVLRKCVIIT